MIHHVDSAWRRGARPEKPFEDCLVAGKDAFVVTDGVTRDAEEYTPGAMSHAQYAARVTAEAVLAHIDADSRFDQALREGVIEATRLIAAHNAEHGLAIPAATVLVCGAIRGGRLHFGYMGDSLILLLRSGARIRLSEAQTEPFTRAGGRKALSLSKFQQYEQITNNMQSPYGYGVVDGDMRALDYLCASSIALDEGDRIIFASDGLEAFLSLTPVAKLVNLSAVQIIEASSPYDQPPYASKADDKAIIIVDIQKEV